MTMTGDRPPDRRDTSVRDRCQRHRAGAPRAAGGGAGSEGGPSGAGYDSRARGRQSGLRPAGR